MRRMFLLCGPAYAGKSTLAAALGERLDARIVSLDEINRERGVGFGGDGLSDDVWAETLTLALERLANVMATGRDVVVDDTSCYRWLRDEYRAVARRHGCEGILVLLCVPRAELERRRKLNAVAPSRAHVTDQVFAGHLSSFEYPQADEPFVRFGLNDAHAEWIEALLGGR
jgi:predicted kinase